MRFQLDKQKINSLIVAISLLASAIASTFSIAFNVTNNANLIVLLIIVALSVIKMKDADSRKIRINIYTIGVVFAMIVLYLCTWFFSKYYMNYTMVQLLFYAIVPTLAISSDFKTEQVLKYTLYISLCTAIAANGFFELQYAFMNQADLGRMYSVLLMVICNVFHFRYYRKSGNTILNSICYTYTLFLIIKMLLVGNRGVILSFICTLFIIILYDFDGNNVMKRLSSKHIILWLSVMLSIMFVVSNLGLTLEIMSSICEFVLGEVPSFFIKMQRYIGFDDLTNGRDEIYIILFDAFKESPIFGHGLVTFLSYTDNTYTFPHNFLLQFLYEGGLVFATIPIYFSVKILFQVLFGKIKYKDQYIMAAMLVCQCYPKLLLSSDAWMGTATWMMIMFSILYTKKKRRKFNV